MKRYFVPAFSHLSASRVLLTQAHESGWLGEGSRWLTRPRVAFCECGWPFLCSTEVAGGTVPCPVGALCGETRGI